MGECYFCSLADKGNNWLPGVSFPDYTRMKLGSTGVLSLFYFIFGTIDIYLLLSRNLWGLNLCLRTFIYEGSSYTFVLILKCNCLYTS